MFFVENILTRKGPLATIWMAVHWEKKLSKTVVLGTNIESIVSDLILGTFPKLALRLSGQILLGISRVYKKKVLYLLDDYAHFSANSITDSKIFSEKLVVGKEALKMNDNVLLDELVVPAPTFDIDVLLDEKKILIPSEEIEIARRETMESIAMESLSVGGPGSLLSSPIQNKTKRQGMNLPPIGIKKRKLIGGKPFICDSTTQLEKEKDVFVKRTNQTILSGFDTLELLGTKKEISNFSEAEIEVTRRKSTSNFDFLSEMDDDVPEIFVLEKELMDSQIDEEETTNFTLEEYSRETPCFVFNTIPVKTTFEYSKMFYQLLSLSAKGVFIPEQDSPYGPITVQSK